MKMTFFHQNLALFWHVEFGWTFAELDETLTYACPPILLFICGGGGGGGSQIFVASSEACYCESSFWNKEENRKTNMGSAASTSKGSKFENVSSIVSQAT